ncbi:hypothetical protein V6N13_027554 [Hibiscus sabdariffa]
MGLLDQLWDDTVAGPPPENGLGMLRKRTFRPPYSAKESEGGSMRSYGDETPSEEDMRVTHSIMIVKPPGYDIGSPPVSPDGTSPPRAVSVSEEIEIEIGRGREDQLGWTKEPSSSLRRVRYEPSSDTLPGYS